MLPRLWGRRDEPDGSHGVIGRASWLKGGAFERAVGHMSTSSTTGSALDSRTVQAVESPVDRVPESYGP